MKISFGYRIEIQHTIISQGAVCDFQEYAAAAFVCNFIFCKMDAFHGIHWQKLNSINTSNDDRQIKERRRPYNSQDAFVLLRGTGCYSLVVTRYSSYKARL